MKYRSSEPSIKGLLKPSRSQRNLGLLPGWIDSLFHTWHGKAGGLNFDGYSIPEFDALAIQFLV